MRTPSVHAALAAAALLSSFHPAGAESRGSSAEVTATAFYKTAFTYTGRTADETLLKARPLFVDQSAFESFARAVRESGNYEAAKKYDMAVTASPGKASSSKGDDGSWKVVFQSLDAYRPARGVGIEMCVEVETILRPAGDGLKIASVVQSDCRSEK